MITKYTALETLTQDTKINKLWTLASAKLLECHVYKSHAIQFFVTVTSFLYKIDDLGIVILLLLFYFIFIVFTFTHMF